MSSHNAKKKIKLIPRAVIENALNDYSDDPYFVKKAELSKKTLEKHGFPKEILDRMRKSKA